MPMHGPCGPVLQGGRSAGGARAAIAKRVYRVRRRAQAAASRPAPSIVSVAGSGTSNSSLVVKLRIRSLWS